MAKPAEAPVPEAATADPAGLVSFKTSQGGELEGSLLRLTPLVVSFEICVPRLILQLSEVLTDFKIRNEEGVIYSGQAVLTSLINTGTAVVCEATLSGALLDFRLLSVRAPERVASPGFDAFLSRWQKYYQVLPEFKLAVTDLESFLSELRLWLGQIELGLSDLPPREREQAERAVLEQLPARPALAALFERFDRAASAVPEELVAAHRRFCRQHLHPLLLLAPFNHRIFAKPLGYAGDYEMIDMIIRNDYEGDSLFAKLIHAYILDLAAAHSVRNRATYFAGKFVEETARVWRLGRETKFYSLGCGPARELQQFLAESSLADHTRFRLLDFNPDTLAHTTRRIEEIKRRHGRRTPVELVRKSVYNLLKAQADPGEDSEQYDMIYCSGLYDYLNDRVCKELNTYLYRLLAPGGLLIVTNFDPSNPIRNLMEYVFEWFLIHRDAAKMAALAPEQAAPDDCAVVADHTACNVFLQVRKPICAS